MALYHRVNIIGQTSHPGQWALHYTRISGIKSNRTGTARSLMRILLWERRGRGGWSEWGVSRGGWSEWGVSRVGRGDRDSVLCDYVYVSTYRVGVPLCCMQARVVVDDEWRCVTSRGPGTAIEFALKLVELVQGPEAALAVAAPMVLPLRTVALL